MVEKIEALPEGYKLEHGVAYGMRMPGLFEIKFHSPKNRNALTADG